MTRPDERRDLPPRGESSGAGGQGGRSLQRGGRIALLLALPGLVLSVVFFPVGLALDVAAIVVGVRALRSGRQHDGKAPGALAAVVIGSVGVLLVAIVITLLGFFWQEARAYQECMRGANTIQSQESCRAKFERAIEERLGLITNS